MDDREATAQRVAAMPDFSWNRNTSFRISVLNRPVVRIDMSSFSCPHFESAGEYCMRLKTDCVPGRPRCVLCKTSVFSVPAEVRIREKEEAKRRERDKR